MSKLHEIIKERPLVFDGAMGTSLIAFNLGIDDYQGHQNCHDFLSISRPDVIKKVHASYLEVGCDIIETNSFGANPLVFEKFGIADRAYECAKAAAKIAKEVTYDFSTPKKPRFVSGSIGPGSKLPTLLQTDFDHLYDSYCVQAAGLIEGGADLLQIETCQDILQAKSALIAAFDTMEKLGRKIPVIVQATIEKNGKMLLGTPIEAVISAFSHYDLFALGMNCGTGPDSMYEQVRTLKKFSPFPVSLLPNAGIPELVDGKLTYSLTPDEFGKHIEHFVKDMGVELVGGCCGTNPAYIKAAVERIKDFRIKPSSYPSRQAAFASTFKVQEADVQPKPLIIGERANANGSKEFRTALLADNFDGMMDVVFSQAGEGSHLIDLSVGYAGRNETADMTEMVRRMNENEAVPLCIDSTDPKTIEAALKCYGGSALINSINLEDGGTKAKEILRLAKRYGASVIALTIDENGMADSCAGKVEIAEKIIKTAKEAGLREESLFIDTLTFTLGSGDRKYFGAAVETFNAIKEIKQRFPNVFTVLGVSNCSYGLKPKLRKLLNAVYLFNAVKYGLDAAIFHSGKVIPIDLIDDQKKKLCEEIIFNRRDGENDPLAAFIESCENTENTESAAAEEARSPQEQLFASILSGTSKELEQNTLELLKTMKPTEIIDEIILKAMQEVGEKFRKGTTQLPFVLKSAETVKKACDMLAPFMKQEEAVKKGSIVLATVKGDIHDIGKNLVDIIMTNNGYTVYNIGIDKTAEEIAEAVRKFRPQAVGLSALLVKSALEMKNVAEYFTQNNIDIPLICGGAALTEEFIKSEVDTKNKGGAIYAKNAFAAMEFMQEKFGVRNNQHKEIV